MATDCDVLAVVLNKKTSNQLSINFFFQVKTFLGQILKTLFIKKERFIRNSSMYIYAYLKFNPSTFFFTTFVYLNILTQRIIYKKSEFCGLKDKLSMYYKILLAEKNRSPNML